MSGGLFGLSISEIGSIVGIAGACIAAAWTIYKWGRKQGPRPVNLVVGFLRPIDTDELARSLQVEGKAVANGRIERPPSYAQQLDSNEQDIVQRITSEWSWQGEAFVNELG